MSFRFIRTRTALVAGIFLLLFTASSASAQDLALDLAPPETQLAEDGPSTRDAASKWLMIGGGGLFGGVYVVNALLGAFAGESFGWGGDGNDWSELQAWGFVPVVGPWVQLAVLPPNAEEDWWRGRLVATGILQAIGFGALVAGLVMRLTGSDDEEEPQAEEASFTIAPTVTATDLGLVATGTF